MLSTLILVRTALWALVSPPQQPASSLSKARARRGSEDLPQQDCQGSGSADAGNGNEVAVPTSLPAARSSVSQAQTQDLEEVAQGPLAWRLPPSLSFLHLTFQPLRWSRYTRSAESRAGAPVFEQSVPREEMNHPQVLGAPKWT